ncbi:MAG: hypothetical protein ACXVFN_03320 [Solirubrobacteraceae bacterium]
MRTAADARRDIAHEVDLGDWWLGADSHEPRFRAAWIEQTGEVYVMQHAGMIGGGTVDVLARIPTREAVERALRGWEDVVGEWGSFAWLVERLGDAVPARVRAIAASPASRPAAA